MNNSLPSLDELFEQFYTANIGAAGGTKGAMPPKIFRKYSHFVL